MTGDGPIDPCHPMSPSDNGLFNNMTRRELPPKAVHGHKVRQTRKTFEGGRGAI